MEELIQLLHQGNYSCVISSGGQIRTFVRRGVMDLWDLLHTDSDFMYGCLVADKVIGKGAAALLCKGKAKLVYADVISDAAFELLMKYNVHVVYTTKVAYIVNRTSDGMCPVEKLCMEEDDLDTLIASIGKFIESMRNKEK